MVSVKVPIGHLCVHAIFFPCFCLDSGFSLYYDLAKWPQVYNQGFKPTKPTGLRFTTMGWTPILTCGCVSPKTHIPSWEDSSFINWIQTIHWQCWMWQTPYNLWSSHPGKVIPPTLYTSSSKPTLMSIVTSQI